MPRLAIVTDSTADFAGFDPAEAGVTVIPLTVHWGHEVLRDRVDLTTSEFYERLRSDPSQPSTSAPPIGIFEEVYRDALERYDAIVSIHIASTLSSTWGVAESAARAVDPTRIHVVDSTSTSVGLGWMVQLASEMAESGHEPEEIIEAIQALFPRLRLYLTLETLDFLQRGGRIGRAEAFLGSLLSVKPLLKLQDGIVQPLERVRTRAASIRRLMDLANGLGARQRIAVVHGDSQPEGDRIRQELERAAPETPIEMAEIGAVIATYAGPGILGVGCILAP